MIIAYLNNGMRNNFTFLLLLFCISGYSQHPDLEQLLKSNDVSYLIHNHVASHNPLPHGWEEFTPAQSPLGRFTFPEVMAMHSGEIYSLQRKGQISQHTMTTQQWLPWLFETENDEIKVRRAVGKDIFMIELRSVNDRNMAVLEMNSFTDHYYRQKENIDFTFDRTNNRFIFKWRDYSLLVTFKGSKDLMMCQNSQPMLRKFQGYTDVTIVDKSVTGCWSRNGITYLGASFDTTLTITMEVTKTPEMARLPQFDELVSTQKKYWTDFFTRQVPPLRTNDRSVVETYYHAWVNIWSNCMERSDGLTPHPYTASSAFMYPNQFFWDEGFHAILYSNLKNSDYSYRFIENFKYVQAPDGGIPGSLSFKQDYKLHREHVTTNGSDDMQPIVSAVALKYLKEKPGWKGDQLRSIYDLFNKYVDWLYRCKDKDKNGLVEYTNSYNSGTDDSPRFDGLFSEGKHVGVMQAVEGVEQNVWLSLMHHNLSEMAVLLGDRNAAIQHEQTAATLEAKIEKHFWNEEDGYYYDINTATHQQIKVKTQFAFLILFMKNAKKDRIRRLVSEHLINRGEFWTEYPIPSVAISEPTFTSNTMWRGPVWPNMNWLICLGLEEHGYHDIAREIAIKTVEMMGPRYEGGICVRGPRFNEWFNPINGKALGNENISWSSTVADLILRYLNE
jgi:alpha,alpha-trehalase